MNAEVDICGVFFPAFLIHAPLFDCALAILIFGLVLAIAVGGNVTAPSLLP